MSEFKAGDIIRSKANPAKRFYIVERASNYTVQEVGKDHFGQMVRSATDRDYELIDRVPEQFSTDQLVKFMNQFPGQLIHQDRQVAMRDQIIERLRRSDNG